MQQLKFKNDPKIAEYFNTLPSIAQESIMQSGIEIDSVEHLKQLSDKFLNEKNTNSASKD